MAETGKKIGVGFWASFLPAFSWMAFFYFCPLAILLSYAFYHHTYVRDVPAFSMESFATIFQMPHYETVPDHAVPFTFGPASTEPVPSHRVLMWPLYLQILLRTFGVALIVTLVDATLAMPVAYFLAFYAGKYRQTLTILALVPLWSSYLVRIYAWTVILGTDGLLNGVLMKLGILKEPSRDFIYNLPSMTLVLCYIWLPFMILPLTTAFERLPRRMLEASADLGAGPIRTFFKVTLPLVFPGLLAGCVTVFSLSMGDYFTPSLMGPGSSVVGDVILRNFGVVANWPLSAAYSFVVLIVLFCIFGIMSFFGALENI